MKQREYNAALKQIGLMYQALGELLEAVELGRASEEHQGEGSLSARDRWVQDMIDQQRHPMFRCDLLRTCDVWEALRELDDTFEHEVSEKRLGAILQRLGRYTRRRVSKNNRSHRLWIMRHPDRYLVWASAELHDEYEKQRRDKVPPGVVLEPDDDDVNFF